MHKIFLEWILSQKIYWDNENIYIEKIVDKINNQENPNFPYVSVWHETRYALGQISLHEVYTGYILEFEAGKKDSDEFLCYHNEFTDNPIFDFWQEKYIKFLCSK